LRALASNALGRSAVAPVAAVCGLGVVGAGLSTSLESHVALAGNTGLCSVVTHEVQRAGASCAALVDTAGLALGRIALIARASQWVADTMLVMGAIVRAFTGGLGAVGVRQTAAVLALVGGVVAALVLECARLLAFILGLLAVRSLCARLALLCLLVATRKLGSLAGLLTLALRRISAIIIGNTNWLGASVVARITGALRSAEVKRASERQSRLPRNEAGALQSRIASVVVDDSATHAPAALKLTSMLTDASRAGEETVARIGVVLNLRDTAAHDHNALIGSRDSAEHAAGTLQPGRRRGEWRVHREHGRSGRLAENRREVAGPSLPGVTTRQRVHTSLVHSIKSVGNRVGNRRIVIAERESDRQSFGTIRHFGSEHLDLGAIVGAIENGDDHVVDGSNRAMGDGAHGVSDGDTVGCEVVVPLAQDKALLNFDTAPYTDEIGRS